MTNDIYDTLANGKKEIERKRLDYEDKLTESTAQLYSEAIKNVYLEINKEDRVTFANDLENLLQKYFIEEPKDDNKIRAALHMSVEDIDFSVRVSDILERAKITTPCEIIKRGESELLSLKGFGKTCFREVKRKLGEYGLRFEMNIEKYLEE